ncbi:efflux RND transporter periplasmic adaptor subunit [Puniceicoccaceae bacterium K14]|nr:efflux RND transporter periplasmic adaptor subunit [Puniceicoccaceae bacterium K14]
MDTPDHTHVTPKKKKNPFFLFVLPIILIVGALAFAGIASKLKSKPEKQEVKEILPVVEVTIAESETLRLNVLAEGNVQARTETNLFAEVSGSIQKISPAFFAGGFFKKGDILIEIDSTDYEANLATAKSRMAEAQVVYEQELAQSEQAKEDWIAMDKGEPNNLVLRKPQLTRANAQIDAAAAAVRIAERDLERTRIKAPYDGRVREKFVDLGQSVNARSSSLAIIYSVDIAEIRLPLSVNEIGFLELPEEYRDDNASKPKPSVSIQTKYAGKTYSWDGIIDRTEGTIDPRTRLTYVVAQVQNPYAKNSKDTTAPPLKVGMFVQAEILGKEISNAFKLPIQALRSGGRVLTIDDSKQVNIRNVTIIKENIDSVIVSGGIEEGDRVCLTPLEYIVDGMKVAIEGEESEADAETPNNNEA